MLLLGAGAVALAACGDGYITPGSPEAVTPGDDSGSQDRDAGTDPGTDGGTTPPDDAGTTPPTDSGTTPPVDSGTTPHDSGVTPPADTGTTPTCTPAPTVLGPLSSFGANTWQVVSAGRSGIIVGHDSGGLYAMSARCTHSGCTVCLSSDTGGSCPTSGFVSMTDGSSSCPCHGSRFDTNGAVTRGPAATSLVNYHVVVCSGMVTCDTTRTVASGTRVPAA